MAILERRFDLKFKELRKKCFLCRKFSTIGISLFLYFLNFFYDFHFIMLHFSVIQAMILEHEFWARFLQARNILKISGKKNCSVEGISTKSFLLKKLTENTFIFSGNWGKSLNE